MRAPRPASLRVFAGDDVHEIKVDGEQNWARLGETIAALDPDRVELYGDSDELLRAEKRKISRNSSQVAIPGVLSSDPETARLTHFSNLLHRAYEHSTEVAFNRMMDMFQMLTDRHQSTESELAAVKREKEALYEENAELRASGPEGESKDILTSMAESFAAGMNNGPANGAATKGTPS